MTNQYYDTDCLSSFLWVHEECLLVQLYSGRMLLPKQVYSELTRPNIPHLKRRTDALVQSKHIQIVSMGVDSRAFQLYREMTVDPDEGVLPIGRGEAAALAFAIENGGVVASNNLRDVLYYAKKYSIRVLTTGEILREALNQGLIDETKGNQIWQKMLSKRRRLPTNTFSEYLRTK